MAVVAILFALSVEASSPMRIDAVAGKPDDASHRDGDTQVATFSHPTGVVADATGNVYIADSGNHVIRMLTPAGEVRTLAGEPGIPGDRDGQGSEARFRNPTGIALDVGGDLLVADSGNCTIRRVSSSGFVTTIAGAAGFCGFDEGIATRARFAHPTGVAVDTNGDIFVADRANHIIRRIRDGLVTTFAGAPLEVGSRDGRSVDAHFFLPFGIAIDAIGDLYIADSGNHTIRKITKDREVTTICGVPESLGSNDGACAEARMNRPSGIAIDPEGRLIVADTDNHTIRRVNIDGTLETLAGRATMIGFVDGFQDKARLFYPFGVASGPEGSVWIVELLNHSLRRGIAVDGPARRRPALRR